MEMIAAPIFEPGHCFVCLTSSGPCVDTRRSDRFGGRIYVCVTCSRDLAAVAGVPPKEKEELVKLRLEVTEMRDDLQEAEEMRRAVARTLQMGAVVRGGKIDVRGRKGVKAPSVHG